MKSSCLFCRIIAGEIPSKILYQNDQVIAFEDISPMAKHHLLFVHRQHTENICQMANSAPNQLVEVMQAIADYAAKAHLEASGFRIVTNCGPDAGHTVFHTHFHVLYGEHLGPFGAKMK